ncbi:pentatricopeptide repeat-containing protein At3g26782, mitochondrial-like [Chenopodium quinoa]|uniref:Pentatricopeptide repeat-containing protein n=1 Tax=Chenopodium quinoa TaxID=63459 RepID=A0A803MBB2_CHEQI|nr:pentatricopeptide repeat-containing protein At3g26782, mitochondrial-like [Chenopodium quinoa]
MNGSLRKLVILCSVRSNFRSYSNWRNCNVHIRDSHDYIHLLKMCSSEKNLKQIHAQIIVGDYEQNPFVASKLLGKYIALAASSMEDARKVFVKLPERDIFLWNMLLQGYSKHGHFEDALSSFVLMRVASITVDQYTLLFVLKACGGAKEIKMGQVIHGYIVKSGFASDLFVGNALVAFYGKCQEVSLSREMFDEMQQKDIVTLNSMISAYVVNGVPIEGLELFRIMLNDETISLDKATLVGILPACAQQPAIKEGLWIHSYIVKSCMELDAAFGSGLISFYANIGRLDSAKLIFDQVSDKNIVVWNAMIRAYGTHGHAEEALKLFSQLVDTGLWPDGLVFLCLLSACSHAGMISEGLELFNKMEHYEVEKIPEHYACIIDLYSRAGLLDEAMKFIKTMPIEAGKDVYGALLGACRIHNNIELAEEVAEKLFDLDPENSGRYLILVKMYEDAGRHQDAARLRTTLRDKKIQRPVGYSAIEIDYNLHTFGAEDESHPFREQIFDTLHKLELVLIDETTVADQMVVNSQVTGMEVDYWQ